MRWNRFFPFHNFVSFLFIHTSGSICSRYKYWLNRCTEDSSLRKELKCAQQHFRSQAVLVNSLFHCWCLCPNQCIHWAALSSVGLEEPGGSSLPPSNLPPFWGNADLLGNLQQTMSSPLMVCGHTSDGVSTAKHFLQLWRAHWAWLFLSFLGRF